MSDDLFKIIRHIIWSSENLFVNKNEIEMSDDVFKCVMIFSESSDILSDEQKKNFLWTLWVEEFWL